MTILKVRGHNVADKCSAKDLKNGDVYLVQTSKGQQTVHQALAAPEVLTTESGKEAVALRCRDA